MKKKILFVIPDFYIGGTNKSLENLLLLIDSNIYEIRIFSLYEDGDFYYKEKVFKPYLIKKSLFYRLFHDHFWFRKFSTLVSLLFRCNASRLLHKFEINRIQKKEKFDTVIAYQESSATICVSMLRNCSNRIAWVHCELRYWLQDLVKGRKLEEAGDYSKYDKIICVSESARQSFLSLYPQLSDKVMFIYNSVDDNHIKELADDVKVNVPFSDNTFNILSVGRFSPTKQFDLIPKIVSELKKMTSKPFCWYIIASREECLQDMLDKIKKYDVSREVILLGAKDNPYPYFKKSDLFVCTSVSESFSYVIAESKVLHVPVLCNNIPVAMEVVSDEEGWICSIADMPETLSRIIENNNSIYTKVKGKILNYQYNNHEILKKFEDIV